MQNKDSGIEIIDQSNDRGFFAQIPHVVTDNLDAVSLALYINMKRFAGDGGKYFVSSKKMIRKLGVGRTKYDNAVTELLGSGFISEIGAVESRTRPVKCYSINDVWERNTEHYAAIKKSKKIGSRSELSRKDRFQIRTKIGSRSELEEDNIKNNIINDNPSDVVQPSSESKPDKLAKQKELIDWAAERRGAKFTMYAKQIKAVNMMKSADISPKEIKDRWMEMENDPYWRSNGFDFMNVANSFNKKR